MSKNREELLAKNESYQAELKQEMDQAQAELIRIARNALIAGSLAFAANLLQRAFFSDDKKKKKFKQVKKTNDFLSEEVTEKASVEALKLASKRLESFLETVEKDGK